MAINVPEGEFEATAPVRSTEYGVLGTYSDPTLYSVLCTPYSVLLSILFSEGPHVFLFVVEAILPTPCDEFVLQPLDKTAGEVAKSL